LAVTFRGYLIVENGTNNSVKSEFTNWINQLDKNKLSNIDTKLLNIIISNFDILAPLGTAGGQRAKKLSELILKHKDTISTVLEINNTVDNSYAEQIEKLDELEIGPFRGFVSQEHFLFDKKYTFIYGPNGSGKSSFFEGLEYALIGDISEATAKRIPLDTYVKNMEKKSYESPTIYYSNSKGIKEKISQNHDQYRFSLIEKIRIDNFARISATTPNEQKDRIAGLFGLDAFSNFVDGFTENFQYLPIATKKADDFSFETQKMNLKNQRLSEIAKELEKIDIASKELINEIGKDNIVNKEQLKVFLIGTDGTNGKINLLLKKQTQEIPQNLDAKKIDNLLVEVNELGSTISSLDSNLNNLNVFSSDVNYKELYTAIIAIGQISGSNRTVCPACKTPIEKTILNPFLNAQKELDKLQELSSLQICIQEESRNIEQRIQSLNKLIKEIENYLLVIGHEKSLIKLTEIAFIDIISITRWLDKLKLEIFQLQNDTNIYLEIKKLIIEYNDDLEQLRNEQDTIDVEIEKYTSYNTRLLEINATEKILRDEIEQINNETAKFNMNNEQTIKEIEIEKIQVEENKKYIRLVRQPII
jgi:DNA repair exonuclease SbcCD ATPase subunit